MDLPSKEGIQLERSSSSDSSNARIGIYRTRSREKDVPKVPDPVWLTIVKTMVLPTLFVAALMGIVLWDMNKVSEMSEIIHDDHHYLWRAMNSTELSRWFTPVDICMLKLDKPDTDVKSFRTHNCSRAAGGKGTSSQKLFCGIGSSIGKPCASPLSTRSFFTQQLRDGLLGDPASGTLKTALRKIAESKHPLIFLGDAVSKQNQEALMCEMLRTDRVWATGNVYGLFNTTTSSFTIHWKDPSTLTLDVHFLHMSHLVHMKHNGGEWKHSSLHAHSSNNPNVTLQGRFVSSLTLDEVQKELQENIMPRYPAGIVLVANVGVWYNTREKFRSEIPSFLQWLSEIGSNQTNLVFYRETAAQHWNHTEHGYFAFEGESSDGACHPLADYTPEFDWRNRDVRLHIENEKLENIHMIAFRDVTAPLHDMHPESADAKDCTHYCYFPQMWQGVWAQMERVVSMSLEGRKMFKRRRNLGIRKGRKK